MEVFGSDRGLSTLSTITCGLVNLTNRCGAVEGTRARADVTGLGAGSPNVEDLALPKSVESRNLSATKAAEGAYRMHRFLRMLAAKPACGG